MHTQATITPLFLLTYIAACGAGSSDSTPEQPDAGEPLDFDAALPPADAAVTEESLQVLGRGRYPHSVVADSSGVYWLADEGAVFARLAGTEEAVVLVDGLVQPMHLVVGGDYAYVAEGRGERVIRIAVEDGSQLLLASNQSNMKGLAIDDERLYWSSDTAEFGSHGSIRAVPLAGGQVVELAADIYEPTRVAVDNSHVYWGAGWAVWRTALDGGGEPTLVADVTGEQRDLALTDSHVYWVGEDDSSRGYDALMRIEKDADNPDGYEVLSPYEDEAAEVELDGERVYWLSWQRSVLAMPLAGGDREILYERGVAGIFTGLARHGDSLYWCLSDFAGEVYRRVLD